MSLTLGTRLGVYACPTGVEKERSMLRGRPT